MLYAFIYCFELTFEV